MKQTILFVAFLTIFVLSSYAQRELGVRPTDTGGPLIPEQAAFDVQSYDIKLNVDPKTKSITGTTVMIARAVKPTNVIVLDLDTPYKIDSIFSETAGGSKQSGLRFERRGGKIWIWFPETKKAGETFETIITYGGTPRVAPRPPWIGGFIWAKTPSGADWVSVALQNDGADLLKNVTPILSAADIAFGNLEGLSNAIVIRAKAHETGDDCFVGAVAFAGPRE